MSYGVGQATVSIINALTALQWPSGAKVFDRDTVRAWTGALDWGNSVPPGFPFCLVQIEGTTSDDDEPLIETVTWELTIATQVFGDPYGEAAMLGGMRSADTAQEENPGSIEIADLVKVGLGGTLRGADGLAAVVSSIENPQVDKGADMTSICVWTQRVTMTLHDRIVPELIPTPDPV